MPNREPCPTENHAQFLFLALSSGVKKGRERKAVLSEKFVKTGLAILYSNRPEIVFQFFRQDVPSQDLW